MGRLNKQINKWCVSDVTVKIMKEQSQRKRRYKQFEIHSNCFYQLSLPSHFLLNVLVSRTWWLTTMGSELITQRLLRRDEGASEKRPPATAFTPSQPCTSKFSAVWPFVSGEQVGFYCELVRFQWQEFLLWLQYQAASRISSLSASLFHRLQGHWGHTDS